MALSQVDMRKKVFVEVLVRHGADGSKIPMTITFEDGRKFNIDKLCDRRRAAASKVGGTGIRYTVRINGRETYLFEDDGFWFVEAKCR